ncbi:hypothetical protein L4D09_27765 [Photobacterium makurazakiensis]
MNKLDKSISKSKWLLAMLLLGGASHVHAVLMTEVSDNAYSKNLAQ